MRLTLLFAIAVAVSLPAQARRAAPPVQEVTVRKGERHGGFAFPEGTKVWLQVHGGDLTRVELAGDFTWNGTRLREGTLVELLGEGSIQFSPVAGQKIKDLAFVAGEADWVRVSKDGELSGLWLRKEKELRGLRFASDCEVVFHHRGRFSLATKIAAQAWRGLQLAEGRAVFHDDGSLKQAMLAKESVYQGLKLLPEPNPANVAHVELFPDGKLKAGLLGANVPLQGLTCGKGRIAFFANGKLESCVMGADGKVVLNPYPSQGPVEKVVKTGDTLFFADDGRVVGWGGK